MYSLKIFDWVEDYIVEKILADSAREKFKAWDIIVVEWEKDNGKSYVIDEWIVDVVVRWKKITELWKWEIFWEIALLREENRDATIIAKTDLVLIVLNLENLIDMVNNDDNLINKQVMKRIKENIEIFWE